MSRTLIEALREEAAHVALPEHGMPLADYFPEGPHAGTGIMIWACTKREGPVNGSVWVLHPASGVVTLHYFTSRDVDDLHANPAPRDDQDEYRAEFNLQLPDRSKDPIEYFGELFADAVQTAKFGKH